MKTKFILLFVIFLSNCSSQKNPQQKPEPPTAQQLYQQGEKYIKEQKYSKAVDNFLQLTQEYPYSELASNAELMEGYAYYLKKDYDMAIATLDNFIKLHPSNNDIAYAYYLRAISYYDQISDVERDQEYTELAYLALKEIINKFPASSYAKEAKFKLELVLDHLAGKEMEIGRFYLQNGDMIGAINRFTRVVQNYQVTSHIEEALARLVEAYLTLGIVDEAKKYASVLGYNYPSSKWYKETYTKYSNYFKE